METNVVEMFEGEYGDPLIFPVDTTKDIITGMTPTLTISLNDVFFKTISGATLALSSQTIDGTAYQSFVWTPTADPGFVAGTDDNKNIYDIVGKVSKSGNVRIVGYWKLKIKDVASA